MQFRFFQLESSHVALISSRYGCPKIYFYSSSSPAAQRDGKEFIQKEKWIQKNNFLCFKKNCLQKTKKR